MKIFCLYLSLIFLTLPGYGQFWTPKPKPAAPVAVVVPQVEAQAKKVAATPKIEEARQIIKELTTNLQTAKEENNKLKINLSNAEKKIETSEKRVKEVERNAELLREWGIARQNEAFEWLSKHDKVLDRYHHLKLVASMVGGVFGFIFGIWLMRFVPPVYGAYALALPLVTTLLASSWVWIFF